MLWHQEFQKQGIKSNDVFFAFPSLVGALHDIRVVDVIVVIVVVVVGIAVISYMLFFKFECFVSFQFLIKRKLLSAKHFFLVLCDIGARASDAAFTVFSGNIPAASCSSKESIDGSRVC